MYYCREGKQQEFLHHGNAFCLKGLKIHFLGAESSFLRMEDSHAGLQQTLKKISVNGELQQVEGCSNFEENIFDHGTKELKGNHSL